MFIVMQALRVIRLPPDAGLQLPCLIYGLEEH